MKSIFLASAHFQGSPLPELVEEIRGIEAVLRPLHERAIWELRSNRAANLSDVFDTFVREGDQIALFHYAGHANQQELQLEGGGKVQGIAALFGLAQGKPLKLVFLNGCASAGMVKNLHQAGIGAVIATTRPIEDQLAREFAICFYQSWSLEGKKLDQSFQIALAFVQSKPAGENFRLQTNTHEIGSLKKEANSQADIPWGIYYNPELGAQELAQLQNWEINPAPQLPPQVLREVRTNATESLLELVYEFEQNDADAQQEIASGKDPLLVLITRLPWTVGTHLRRLFAVEDSQSMAESGLERLRELISGYTELTRFICYLSLSALWDERQIAGISPERLSQLPSLPHVEEPSNIDFIWRLRQYFGLQKEISGDPFELEGHLEQFLHTLDTELLESYRFMEELKRVLSSNSPAEHLNDLVQARTGKAKGIREVCLQTEAIFSRFLRSALFLTKYRLYTVRSILVDKIRYLDQKSPYIHKTMSLHGAFSDVKLIPTPRSVASDNACILFALAKQNEDPLAGALNLTPFYIDKSAYLEDKITHYPAIYVFKYQAEGDEFVYEYLDGDVNHQYIFAEDHHLIIRKFGAIFPTALKIDIRDSQRFQVVYKQLHKLKQDFSSL